ncbi:MAG: hypothetical protein ACM3N0_12855 [Chloroflexota bacterium]
MLAATAPDPGSLGFAATCAMVFSFVGTAYAFLRREPKESIQWKAFLGTFIGVGVGLMVWAFALATGLY